MSTQMITPADPGTCRGVDAPLTRRSRLLTRLGEDTGASTAEYAITVLAACDL